MTWRVVDVDPATTTGDRVVVLERGACVVVVRRREDGATRYCGRGMREADVVAVLGAFDVWGAAAEWIARRVRAA